MRQLLPLLLCLLALVPLACSDDEEAKTSAPQTSEKTSQMPADAATRRIFALDENDAPLAAKVTILAPLELSKELPPNADGVTVPEKATKFVIQAQGYLGRELSMPTSQAEARVRLSKLATLTLRVQTPSGEAIPNVAISATRTIASPAGLLEPTLDGAIAPMVSESINTHVSDANGEIKLGGLVPLASYHFTTNSQGFSADAGQKFTPLAASDETLTIKAEAKTWLCGTLAHKDFHRFDDAHAAFYFERESKRYDASMLVMPNGRFALPVDATENGQLSASWTNSVDGREYHVRRNLAVEFDKVHDLGKLNLVALWIVMGHVTRDGTPLAKASLELTPLVGVIATTNDEGGFRFKGIDKSEILRPDAKFKMVIFDGDVATEVDVTKAVVSGEMLKIDLDGSKMRQVMINAIGAAEEPTWRVQSLVSNLLPVKTGSGRQAELKLYPGSYRIWMHSGDAAATMMLEVSAAESDAAPIICVLELGPSYEITPQLAEGIGQATLIIFNEQWQPIGLEVLALFRGAATGDLAKSWRVPAGRYKVRATLLGRNVEFTVDCTNGDQTFTVE